MAFEELKRKLGFGAMRLKMNGDEVDIEEFSRMADAFIDAGFNYFDTAHGYIDGKSELAVRDALTSRHSRDEYLLADKLSEWYIKEEKDVLPFFENQLKRCGVDYFDFYLLHAVSSENYEKYKACNAFEIVKQLKAEGKIRHVAMSFHDTAEVLDKILSEQPAVEVVQLQINYLDFDDPGIQSKACYDVAVKHGKKVIVMEPVKGGRLVQLPARATEVFDALGSGGSYASYAIRYAASYPEVIMVLSGMGNMDMMNDNISTMRDFKPLTDTELAATDKARAIIREVRQIPCTACGYCTEVCPKKIPIPELFGSYNKVLAAKITRQEAKELFPKDKPSASECISCGKCESVCPQGIDIRKKLEKIAKID